jgi:hypothetical protein
MSFELVNLGNWGGELEPLKSLPHAKMGSRRHSLHSCEGCNEVDDFYFYFFSFLESSNILDPH